MKLDVCYWYMCDIWHTWFWLKNRISFVISLLKYTDHYSVGPFSYLIEDLFLLDMPFTHCQRNKVKYTKAIVTPETLNISPETSHPSATLLTYQLALKLFN